MCAMSEVKDRIFTRSLFMYKIDGHGETSTYYEVWQFKYNNLRILVLH